MQKTYSIWIKNKKVIQKVNWENKLETPCTCVCVQLEISDKDTNAHVMSSYTHRPREDDRQKPLATYPLYIFLRILYL